VALITLDEEEIIPWASEQGLPAELAELAATDEVRRLVQEELDRVNSNYASVEQIKKFAILKRELSIEDGELTPTLKVKRAVVQENYKELLDSLYGG
jgi:long-chain acyl-CoA synthetase